MLLSMVRLKLYEGDKEPIEEIIVLQHGSLQTALQETIKRLKTKGYL